MTGLFVTWKGAWREAWSNRRGFWFQIVITVLNDAMWIVFWVLFFRRVGEIRGWDIDQLIVLQAILTTGGGISLGLLANARHTGNLILNGGLDAALAVPSPTLAYLLVRRVYPINVGDIVFGVGVFVFFGNPTLSRTIIYLAGVVTATVLFTSLLVLVGSSAFWLGRNDVGDLGFHAILLFPSYPVDVFSGVTKVLMFTVIPAGFITGIPSRLVDDFDLGLFAATLTVAVGFAIAAVVVFDRGLRRYTSGAIWTTG